MSDTTLEDAIEEVTECITHLNRAMREAFVSHGVETFISGSYVTEDYYPVLRAHFEIQSVNTPAHKQAKEGDAKEFNRADYVTVPWEQNKNKEES